MSAVSAVSVSNAQNTVVEKRKMIVTWEKYFEMAEELMWMIDVSAWKFDHVVCIARGGMPLGDMASRLFKKPLAVIVTRSGEGDTKDCKVEISEDIAKISGLGKRVLLVDNLLESGRTLEAVKVHILENNPEVEEVRTAVLWRKIGKYADSPPHYCAGLTAAHIVLPFEKYDTVTLSDIRKRIQINDVSSALLSSKVSR